MKRSVLRLCSAFLLFGITLAVFMGMVDSANGEGEVEKEKNIYVWVRMLFQAEASVQQICLYSAEGLPVQTLMTDEKGIAASGPLIPGRYYAVTEQGCTEFVLYEDASVSAEGGRGWTDGEILHLTSAEVGRITISRQTSDDPQETGWLDYTLTSGDFSRRKVLRTSGTGALLTCSFEGIPYGTYTLEENGVFQCKLVLNEENRDISLSLP